MTLKRDGACIVCGSEDMNVRLYDVVGGVCVNELQGHSAAVLGEWCCCARSLVVRSALTPIIVVVIFY